MGGMSCKVPSKDFSRLAISNISIPITINVRKPWSQPWIKAQQKRRKGESEHASRKGEGQKEIKKKVTIMKRRVLQQLVQMIIYWPQCQRINLWDPVLSPESNVTAHKGAGARVNIQQGPGSYLGRMDRLTWQAGVGILGKMLNRSTEQWKNGGRLNL